jgi:N-acetylglutamate synthase-like GNAT family acetyltransferase
MIRRATADDVPALVAMGARFLAEGPYAATRPTSADALEAFVAHMVSHAYVVRSDHGMLAGHAFAHPITGEPTASEVAWWVEPEARGGLAALRLLTHFEAWAADHGVRAVQMIAPAGTRLGRLYARYGYRELETTWEKRRAA